MNISVLKNTFLQLLRNLAMTNRMLSIAIFFFLFTSLPACKVKEGCPTKGFTNNMENSTKHGKSNLFDKKMRKKVKK